MKFHSEPTYTDSSLYYLNQLGISVWVNKTHLTEKKSIKLLVLCAAGSSPKARNLLNKIMDYIKLPYLILELEVDTPASQLDVLKKQLQNSSPMAILVSGLNATELLNGFQLTCPVYSTVPLETLVTNPIAKKQIFNDLLTIQSLLDL